MECFSCHTKVQFEDKDLGIRARCPSCGEWLTLGAQEAPPVKVREQDKETAQNGNPILGCWIVIILGACALFALKIVFQFLLR